VQPVELVQAALAWHVMDDAVPVKPVTHDAVRVEPYVDEPVLRE